MEHEVSLSLSKEPTTDPNPEPEESSLHLPALFP